jgi:hypothetical protein
MLPEGFFFFFIWRYNPWWVLACCQKDYVNEKLQ